MGIENTTQPNLETRLPRKSRPSLAVLSALADASLSLRSRIKPAKSKAPVRHTEEGTNNTPNDRSLCVVRLLSFVSPRIIILRARREGLASMATPATNFEEKEIDASINIGYVKRTLERNIRWQVVLLSISVDYGKGVSFSFVKVVELVHHSRTTSNLCCCHFISRPFLFFFFAWLAAPRFPLTKVLVDFSPLHLWHCALQDDIESGQRRSDQDG